MRSSLNLFLRVRIQNMQSNTYFGQENNNYVDLKLHWPPFTWQPTLTYALNVVVSQSESASLLVALFRKICATINSTNPEEHRDISSNVHLSRFPSKFHRRSLCIRTCVSHAGRQINSKLFSWVKLQKAFRPWLDGALNPFIFLFAEKNSCFRKRSVNGDRQTDRQTRTFVKVCALQTD